MVFFKLGLGFVAGVALTMNCDEKVFMTIASCFYRPHLAYFRLKK